MSDAVYFNGTRYVSAGDAAAEAALTRDYVARLCKDGRVAGRKIGKQWYVRESALRSFIIEQSFEREKRKRALAESRKVEYHTSTILAPNPKRSIERAPTLARTPFEGALRGAMARMPSSAEHVEGVMARVPIHATSLAKHGSVHAAPPIGDALHKIIAAVVALLFTVGTYMFVDAQFARVAERSSTFSAALAKSARTQVAAFADNPLAIGDAFAGLARSFSANVDKIVYGIMYPASFAETSPSKVTARIVGRESRSVASDLAAAPTLSSQTTPQIASGGVVVERVVETQRIVSAGGLTEEILNERLAQLDDRLSEQIYAATAQTSQNSKTIVNNYAAVGGALRIDELDEITLSDSTITGGSISGASVSATSLAVTGSGTSTFSGGLEAAALNITSTAASSTFASGINIASGCFALNGVCVGSTSASSTLLSDNNTWSGLNIFANATSTLLTSTESWITNLTATYSSSTALTATSLFGSNALLTGSSTIGGGTQATGLTIAGGATTTGFLVVEGSATSTIASGLSTPYLDVTGTSASSTFANGIDLSAGCFAINGTCVGQGSGAAFAWDTGTNFGTAVVSTTTPIWFRGSAYSLFASSTSVFDYATTTALTVSGTGYFGTASTTNLFVANDATTTNATTTNFAISSLASALLSTNANGSVIATTTIGLNLIPDNFLRNDADDSTSGSITATEFVADDAAATSTFAGGLTVDSTDFVVDPDGGRVGIGTASPTAGLHVTSPDYWQAYFQTSGTSDRTTTIQLENNNVSSRKWDIGVGGVGNGVSLSNGEFYLYDYGAGALRLAVDTGGNLDIESGALEFNGTSVITSGRALQNLTGINSSGTITFSGIGKDMLLTTDGSGNIVSTSTPQVAAITATSTTALNTFPQLSFTAATGTKATTTNFAISSLANALLSTNANGSVIATTTIGVNLIPDNFLRNDGDDTTTGAITATEFTANDAVATSTFAGGLAVETSGLVYDFSSNRVGIGLANPQNILHIQETNNTDTNPMVSIEQLGSGDSAAQFTRGNSVYTLGIDGSDARFKISAGLLGVQDRFVIDALGNVGIGTSTPNYALTVSGTGAPQLSLGDGTHNAWTFRNSGGTLFLATSTYSATSSVSALTINPNGWLGVGTSSPSAMLAVSGGLHVAGQCVTGDTRLRRRRRRRRGEAPDAQKGEWADDQYIYDEPQIVALEEGDEIQSLDERTGEMVWSRINKVMFMGVKQTYRITTEDGRTIRTTAEHPYLVKNAKGKWLAHSSALTARPGLAVPRAGWATVANLKEGDEIAVGGERVGSVVSPIASLSGLSAEHVDDYEHISNNAENHSVFTGAQTIRVGVVPAFQFGDMWTFVRMLERADLREAMKYLSLKLLFNPLYFLLTGRGKEVGVHAYTPSCLRNSRPSVSFSPFAFLNARLILATNFGSDISTRSIISSRTSSEIAEEGATTPRRFLSSMTVMSDALFMAASIAPAAPKLQWSRIVSIKAVAEEDVYDVEIEGTHNFVAGHYVDQRTGSALTPDQEEIVVLRRQMAQVQVQTENATPADGGFPSMSLKNPSPDRTSYTERIANTKWMSSEVIRGGDSGFLQPLEGVEPSGHGIRSPVRHQASGFQRSYHEESLKKLRVLAQKHGVSRTLSSQMILRILSSKLRVPSEHSIGFGGIVAHNTYLGGNVTTAGTITSTATAANTFPYASSTALTTSGTGYFGTASTTNLTISGIQHGLLSTNATGGVSATTTIGNALLAGGGALTVNTSGPLGGGGSVALGGSLTLTCTTCSTAGDPFTHQSYAGLTTSATTSALHTTSLLAASTTDFTYASSTVFTNTGATFLTSLTSALLSTNGSGQVVATTSLGASLIPDLFLRNDQADTASGLITFTNGLLSQASSTIGAGGQATGLTIFGGATTTGNLVVEGTGTSTFAGQIVLENGNDIWWEGSGGSPASVLEVSGDTTFLRGAGGTPTLKIDNSAGTNLMTFLENGNVGIGTSTPWAKLAVQASAAQTNPVFEVASSSVATKFLTVSGTGFGTTTLSGLNIAGSATSTSNVGYNITTGCFAVNGTCVGGGGSGGVGSGTQGQLAFYNAAGTNLTATSTIFISTASKVGIGDSTPSYKLDVAGDVNVSAGSCFRVDGVCIGYVKRLAMIFSTTTPGSGTVDFGDAAGFSGSTITLPASTTEIAIELNGGGGGGSGGGSGGGAGNAGGITYFGTDLIGAGAGSGGTNGSFGAGGTASTTCDVAIRGSDGGSPNQNQVSGDSAAGGSGGASYFGGAGSGNLGGNPSIGTAGSGGGGGRVGGGTSPPTNGGGGGGAGAYCRELITSLSASYQYRVGAGGSGGAAGTEGNAGAAGGAGVLVITVYATSSPTAAGNDYAEMFPVSNPSINAGDIVAVDGGVPVSMKLAQAGERAPLAGVISTEPGQLLGDINELGQRPVALMGRVPVKVNMENGHIKIGDRIAPSSVPGIGKKAGIFDASVGIALDAFDGTSTDSSGVGLVTIFLNIQSPPPLKVIGDGLLESSVEKEGFDFVNGLLLTIYSRISSHTASSSPLFANKSGFIAVKAFNSLYNESPSRFSSATSSNESLTTLTASTTTALLDYLSIVPALAKSIGELDGKLGGSDYAEYVLPEQGTAPTDYEPGELLCIKSTSPDTYGHCESAGDGNVVGVVSTLPGIIGNAPASVQERDPFLDTLMLPMAMLGRVPVKVNLEGGDIHIGDRLAASSEPGYATKATTTAQTIGLALEDFTATSTRKTVDLYIQPQLTQGLEEHSAIEQLLAFAGPFSSSTPTTTPVILAEEEDTFMGGFLRNLFARITRWLADAANGIGDFFAERVLAKKEICVDGECLDADDIRALKQLAGVGAAHSGLAGEGGPATAPPAEGAGAEDGETGVLILRLKGESFAKIGVGEGYQDAGVEIVDPFGNTSEGYRIYVNSLLAERALVDTATTSTHTVEYRMNDHDSKEMLVRRIVLVGSTTLPVGDSWEPVGSAEGIAYPPEEPEESIGALEAQESEEESSDDSAAEESAPEALAEEASAAPEAEEDPAEETAASPGQAEEGESSQPEPGSAPEPELPVEGEAVEPAAEEEPEVSEGREEGSSSESTASSTSAAATPGQSSLTGAVF